MSTLRLLLQVLLHPDLRYVLRYADREKDYLAIRRAAALGFFRAPDGRLHAKFAVFCADLRDRDRAC
jgi:hypothetical protein